MIVILNFTIYNCTSLNFLMCWLAGESTNPTRHLQGALSILLFMHRSLALRMFNVAEIEIGLIDWFWWTYLLSSRYHSFFLLKEWTHFCSKQHTVTKWSKNVTVKGIYTAGPASPMFPPYAPPLPSVVLRTFKQQPDAPTHMSERFRDMSLLTRDPLYTSSSNHKKYEGGGRKQNHAGNLLHCILPPDEPRYKKAGLTSKKSSSYWNPFKLHMYYLF